MENLFAMIEEATSHEISSLDQVNQEKMQEFLSKLATWDFYEMTREEYTSKSEDDKKLLILKYYNHLLSGIFLLFVTWIFLLLSGFCSDFCVMLLTRTSSVSVLILFFVISITRFSPVNSGF